MSKFWYGFSCNIDNKPNLKLAELLVERAVGLGYEPSKNLDLHSLAKAGLAIAHPDGPWQNGIMYDCKGTSESRVEGDINDFLFTDKYKWILKKKPIEVYLNKDYVAKVTDKEIVVGCTTFPIAKLEELNQALKSYNNQ